MKKITINRFTPTSVFKTVLMAITIPFIFFFGLFLLIALVGGSVSNDLGTGVAITAMLIPLLLMPVMYGLMAMLLAASYNWLAPRFGGLVIETEENMEEVKVSESKLDEVLDKGDNQI